MNILVLLPTTDVNFLLYNVFNGKIPVGPNKKGFWIDINGTAGAVSQC